MNKRSLIISLIALGGIALVFVAAPFVQAQTTTNAPSALGDIGNSTVYLIGTPLKWIMYLGLVIESFFITLAGMLVGVALQFNASILSFEPPFITTGWQIFRDIANLGFVIGIVVIAVMTILRVKGYQAQQILWKLIVAALVVNFSLLIGGAIIQPANSISQFLVNYIGSGDYGSAAKLADSFRFIDIINSVNGADPTQNPVGEAASAVTFGAVGNAPTFFLLASMAVVLVFGLVMFLTLFSIAGMFVLRYFYLAFLLMISPIAWLLWIFPKTSRHFHEWWEKFIHWTIYMPIMLLFLYIALLVLDKYPSTISSQANGFAGAGNLGVNFGLLVTSLFATAILLGGLKIAGKMGVGGTDLALGAVNKGGKWIKGKATNYRKKAWEGAGRGAAKARKGGLESKIGRNAQAWISKVPLVGGKLSTGMEVMKSRADKTLREKVDTKKERLKVLSAEQSYKELKAKGSKADRAALLENILDKDKKLDPTKIGLNEAGGVSEKELTDVLMGMVKNGRGKEADTVAKRLGLSLDMLEYSQIGRLDDKKKKDRTKVDDKGKTYYESDREDVYGVPLKLYKDKIEEAFEKLSQEDIKAFAATIGKNFYSSDPAKSGKNALKHVPLEFQEALLNKIKEQNIDPYSSFYQATASKLDGEGRKNHFEQTASDLIGEAQKAFKAGKLEAEVYNAALSASLSGNKSAAMEELAKSKQNQKISAMANKMTKTMGSLLTRIEEDDRTPRKQKQDKSEGDKNNS